MTIGQMLEAIQGVVDVALRGHEHENVATERITAQALDRSNGLIYIGDVVSIFFIGSIFPVFGGDGISATGYRNNRRIVKMRAKTLSVYGCRGDNQLELGPLGKELLQITKKKVNVQTAFVRLIDDDGVVLAEQAVGAGFG